MMRRLLLLFVLVALGCGGSTAEEKPPAKPPTVNTNHEEPALNPAAGKGESPPDLRTRITGSDWPGFLGPTGDSKSSEKGILTPWPKDGLRLVWQKTLGTSYGMPAISRGRLFQFDRFGDKATLNCFKSETGEFLWRFEYPTDYEDYFGYNNGPRCCPVVDDDRVYIYGAEGMLHCIRVVDGQLLWKVDTFAEFGVIQNFFGVGSTPVVEGDLLIAQVGGSPKTSERFPTLDQEGNGSGIVAFDKYNGKVRYKGTDEMASYAVPVLTTIGGRRWCFVFARGGLVGFEPASGKIDFHYPWRARVLESVNAANPVVAGDRVLVTECYGPGSAFLKVKPGGYDVLWTDADRGRGKALQAHWTTPIYHEGHVYGDSGRHSPNADLRCVELETGKVKWRMPGLGHVSLLMIDGHFICLTEEGEVLLLKVNPEKYAEVSRLELRGALGRPLLEYPAWAAPIVSHGLLYVRGKDRLVCLGLIPPR
jgi:outer membrane protein assembly factor BamB